MSVTYECVCERDVRATMPRGASGRRRLAASPLAHHAHGYASTLICFAFFPTVFEEVRDCSQSTGKSHLNNAIEVSNRSGLRSRITSDQDYFAVTGKARFSRNVPCNL